MLNNIFFTIVFFILDHFLLMLLFNLLSLIAMRFVYLIWRDQLRPSDVRYISFIILILLAIIFMLFLMVIIYLLSIFIIYFHEIGKFTGKW
jgi:hypothetical protein